jgi:hypothetical protein
VLLATFLPDFAAATANRHEWRFDSMATHPSSGVAAAGRIVELRWKEFFRDPVLWVDNRTTKVQRERERERENRKF